MNEFPVDPSPSRRTPPIMVILIIILAIGSISFAIATIFFFNQARIATTTLDSQKASAAKAAREDQKAIDESEAKAVIESPYRTYTAPAEYGGFQIKYPKTWSAYAATDRGGSTQVSLIVHPDVVVNDNNIEALAAAKITLVQKTGTEYMDQFKNKKKLTQSAIKVSGVNAVSITGTFDDKRTVRQVVVPVRDKVLVFSNEATAYSKEFNEILAQSVVVP